MKQIRLITSLLFVLVFTACSGGGDDEQPQALCGASCNECQGARCKEADLEEPNVKPPTAPFFVQNQKYSDAFIAFHMEENDDIAVQNELQLEKRQASREYQKAQSRLEDKNTQVKSLQNKLSQLEAKNGNKAGEIVKLENDQRRLRRENRRLTGLISGLNDDVDNLDRRIQT
ncbi:MAG: hypothetical protein AAF203_06435, partial [Pseudomonadota bacterium]